MNFPPFSSRSKLFPVLAGLLLAGFSHGYDIPAFHEAPFDRDGIFLTDEDRQTLLEALASVASNFPATASVDADLIEKSLAIALTLDPFHTNSRAAHSALADGARPAPTGFFDSRSAVAESLWSIAGRMLAPPQEPEAARLAPLLMEISLLTHPEPGLDRILLYEEASRGKAAAWNDFVSLQPELYESNQRLQNLRREARTARKETTETAPDAPTASDSAPDAPAPAMNSGETSSFLPAPGSIPVETRSLAGVFPANSAFPAGLFTLEIREPAGTTETAPFPFLHEMAAMEYPALPILTTANSGAPVSNLTILRREALELSITWPQGAIGAVAFDPVTTNGESRVHGLLPLLLTLKSITDSRDLNSACAVLGSYRRDSESFIPISSPLSLIDAAGSLQKPYLLIPADTLPALLEELQDGEGLASLLRSPLISYETLPELYHLVTLPEIPEAWGEADRILDEIEAVTSRMPLPELARNEKVQERLAAILELVPNHYSAKAMLEFGRAPVSGTARVATAAAAIEEIIAPYFALREEYTADTNALNNGLEAVEEALFRMRTEIPPEVRDYHTLATDMIAAAEVYLSLSNKTTSIATQRLREMQGLLDRVEAARDALGVGAASE